jgi:plastocyanin
MLMVASAGNVANSEDSGDHGNTITIVGSEQLQINKIVSATFRFSPGQPIHVNHGDKITLKEESNDGHTLTLVDASALPTDFNGVLFCGSPDVSPGFVGSPACVKPDPSTPSTFGYPFAKHLTPFFPPPWLPIPASCTPAAPPTPICYQYVDGGVPSNTNTLGLDTAWSFSPSGSIVTAGDSILILPGQTITVTVTAPAGTHLHFICIFHPWMQGEIIVDSSGE